MEKILTKEEIEALLEAVFEGRIEPEAELAKAPGAARNYNLFSSDSTKGNVPNLDLIYDSFIRYHRVNMSNRLGKMVEIRKTGAAAYKFDDFIQTLPSPVCMAVYKAEPLKGAALIALDSSLVFTIVDCILGGTGTNSSAGGNRSFTSIELKLVQKIVSDMLLDLEKAWAPLFAARMSVLRMELNPRLVNIVPPEYQVVTMSLEIHIEQGGGMITFAIPTTTLDPIRDKLKSGMQLELMAIDPNWAVRLSDGLLDAPLEFSVELGKTMISLDELLGLVPGDTLMLDTPYQNDLPIKVGGMTKFMGQPGVKHGNKAIKITKFVEQKGDKRG